MMRLGLLSDSHDNIPKLEKAVRFFNKQKVGFVFHAGDFVAPFTVKVLKALKCDWCGVFGNNDGEKTGLASASEGRIQEGPLSLELKGRQIVIAHDLNQLNLKSEKAELIIFGHTHKPQILRQSAKLLVNPGECGGWLFGKPTVALIDLDSFSAKIYAI
ncbi:MAG: metallophosphoesterase [bacterium]